MFMTVKDVQKKLNVSLALVYRLVDRGELASHRIGKSIRISEEDLEDYLRKTKVLQTPPIDSKTATTRLNNLQL